VRACVWHRGLAIACVVSTVRPSRCICRQQRKREEAQQEIGIRRDGPSRKVQRAVNSKSGPLNLVVTGGQVHDSQATEAALETSRPPVAVTADKAYDAE
jgi:hypothetical protein